MSNAIRLFSHFNSLKNCQRTSLICVDGGKKVITEIISSAIHRNSNDHSIDIMKLNQNFLTENFVGKVCFLDKSPIETHISPCYALTTINYQGSDEISSFFRERSSILTQKERFSFNSIEQFSFDNYPFFNAKIIPTSFFSPFINPVGESEIEFEFFDPASESDQETFGRPIKRARTDIPPEESDSVPKQNVQTKILSESSHPSHLASILIKKEAIIYTDGACKGNPGPGGWAVVFKDAMTGKITELGEFVSATTNNRMELQAIIMGLRVGRLNGYSMLNVFSDSKICLQTYENWIDGWAQKKWKKADGKPVKNVDLVIELHNEKQEIVKSGISVKMNYVKGHSGDLGNDRADLIASSFAEQKEIDNWKKELNLGNWK